MDRYLKTLLFSFFLLPVSMGTLSVNYSFVLFSAMLIFFRFKLVWPRGWVSVAIIVFLMIFLLGAPFVLIAHEEHQLRGIISFLIFMSIFSFSLIRITPEDIEDFKLALIMFSCFMAGWAFFTYLLYANDVEGEGMKNIVGSQRIGFIYIIGLFVLLYRNPSGTLLKLMKLGGVFLLLVGIILTYSRSSVIALVGVIVMFTFVKMFHWQNLRVKDIRKAAGAVVGAFTTVLILYLGFPSTFEFFGDRILFRYGSYFSSIIQLDLFSGTAALLPADVFIKEGSEGTRLAIWSAIVQYTLQNPLLGSGYLGSWVLINVTTGSAHSQYMDVLLRVGFLGFAVWVFTIFKVFKFLMRHHPDLFWGGVGILIYGLFHETFKESQGAFILAFLIGMYANHVRERRLAKATPKAFLTFPSIETRV